MKTFNFRGVALKTIIGLIITVISASTVISMSEGTFMLYGIGGLLFSILFFIVINVLFKMLSKGTALSPLIYGAICVVEGVLFASIMNIFSSILVDSGYNVSEINATFTLAGILTVSVIIGSIILVSITGVGLLKKTWFVKLGQILMSTMLVILALMGISFLLGLLGINFFGDLYAESFIGNGPLGYIISVLFILYAGFVLIRTLANITDLRANKASKQFEYLASAMLVMSIINLYIEILRLLVRSKR